MSKQFGISVIADRYAQAMFELSEEKGITDLVRTDILSVSNSILESKELRQLLEHPLIKVNVKKEILEEVFFGKINDYLLNLVRVLLDRNRMFLFTSIAESFVKAYNKSYNIAIADVITAVSIDENVKTKIQEKLAEILAKNIVLNTKVDAGIIGGVIVKVEDNIIDGSIKGRLESIKRQLV